ncbi:NAD(P)-binding protein [Periconia macrospinosa]|uniref:NAD(P)-binding protein n=1 Tax=Periconia macrospinosa TaxID=97972 RepID=A0A2V1DXL3_9PLEO|nr:NAD(P)-binding protein [Periconia macrospinosa]
MPLSSITGIAIVVGAAGGIGKEAVFALAEAGAKGVICADIKGDEVKAIAEQSKALAASPDFKSSGFAVDVTDSQSVQSLVRFAVNEFGRIDYLINAAGVRSRSAAMVSNNFNRVHDVNARGAFLLSKAVAPVMAGQEPYTITTKRFGERTLSCGSIVHVASAMAFGAVPCKTAYITAKHALLGITRASAMDLSSVRVRVNMVSPTWVETPMLDSDREHIPHLDKIIQKAVPNGRLIGPDEVAAAILYLCGAESTFITGSNVMIDGGLSLGPTFT